MRVTSPAARAAHTVKAVAAASLLATVAVLASAAPAAADTPTTWEPPSDMSLLTALLVFAGGPLAITVVLVLLVMAPAAVKGGRQQTGHSRWSEPHWFGGPPQLSAGGSDDRALPAGSDAGQAAGQAAGQDAVQGGGASARW